MSTVNLLARDCTLFTTTKALDPDAYRESLQPSSSLRSSGPFLASSRLGRGRLAVARDEVHRVFRRRGRCAGARFLQV